MPLRLPRLSRRASALAVIAAAGVAAAVIALRLWFHPWAPRVVRMLPPGETLAYVNLKPLRQAGWLTKPPAPSAVTPGKANAVPVLSAWTQSPSYTAFVQASGFAFTRDLDAVACSLRGAPTDPDETTCVLEGRFQPAFRSYLAAHAQHRQRLDGVDAYGFPGWSRPRQTLWVVPLGARDVLATNDPSPAEAVRQARHAGHRSPRLWQAPVFAPAPMAYLAVDTLRLAAARQIDGTQPPWLGAQRLELRLVAGPLAGVELRGEERSVSQADAASALAWMRNQVTRLLPLLPPGKPGQISVRRALRDLRLRQDGNRVELRLRLEPPRQP